MRFILPLLLLSLFLSIQAESVSNELGSFIERLPDVLGQECPESNSIAETVSCLKDHVAALFKARREAIQLLLKYTISFQAINKARAQEALRKIDDIWKQATEFLARLAHDETKESAQDEEGAQLQLKARANPRLNSAVDDLPDVIGDIKSRTQKIAHACFRNILENIPPSFCWKKDGDFGEIPTGCPPNYFRNIALCYENCEPGYTYGVGSCRKDCEAGYNDKGLICSKGFFNWYFKKIYFNNWYTNFNDNVPCSKGKYKAGALCYKDCRSVGLANCGWAGCSRTKDQCLSSILQISVDFLLGLGKLITFIGKHTNSTNSTLTGIVGKIQEGMDKVGGEFMKKSFDSLKKWIGDNSIKAYFVDLVANATSKFLEEKFNEYVNTSEVQRICGNVHEEVQTKILNATNANLTAGDLMQNAGEVINECKNVDLNNNSTEDEAQCIKKVLNTAGLYDPTGITTMFAAFAQPICNVDVEL